jgi:ATP-dependent DNA helicase RecQ
VLKFTADGVRLLKDPDAMPHLALARQKKPERDRAPRRARGEVESWDGVDRGLFDRLRAFRLTVARARGVPPYVIFHDATLRELARTQPTHVEALQHVYGVGARKAEVYGESIVEAIRSHQAAAKETAGRPGGPGPR